ncbi:MAG: glycosyltransferase family 2 protein [Candidatus Omnitrophica bacterium]|nr:glycosyltransferase family 2 protein [Candidatus Omnitrophota bacterium]
MAEKIFLTVIIPAYNEERHIKETLYEISGYLKKRGFDYEVMIVDDGSIDRTAEIAQSAAPLFNNFALLKNENNRGKGYAVRRGMLAAKGEYALFMDADNSTSIYEFDKFLPCIKESYDVVIASRRLKESLVEDPQPMLRAKMGQLYIFLTKLILKLNLSDFNCGFKVYKVKPCRFIFDLQRMDDWSFDVELLFLINKYGLKIKEIPVRWVHKSGSKVKPVKDAVRSFLSIIKIKSNDLKDFYKIK